MTGAPRPEVTLLLEGAGPGDELARGDLIAQVYAEQERSVRRRVALKIIKPGMDTEQVIARFEAERQALVLMDHPRIAKALDAGKSRARHRAISGRGGGRCGAAVCVIQGGEARPAESGGARDGAGVPAAPLRQCDREHLPGDPGDLGARRGQGGKGPYG
jgi:hypothetical protein